MPRASREGAFDFHVDSPIKFAFSSLRRRREEGKGETSRRKNEAGNKVATTSAAAFQKGSWKENANLSREPLCISAQAKASSHFNLTNDLLKERKMLANRRKK